LVIDNIEIGERGENMKQKILQYILLHVGVFLCIMVTGCSVIMPTAIVPYPETISPKDIVAASVVALQEQEYPVTVVNENIGLVTTDWKNLTSKGSEIAQALLSGKVSHSRMKITITVNRQKRQINLKPLKQYESGYGAWQNQKLSDGDYKKIDELVNRICDITGIKKELIWIQAEQ